MTSRSGGGGRAEGAAGAWSECGSASNCMPEDAAKVKEKQVNINHTTYNVIDVISVIHDVSQSELHKSS